MRWELHFVNDGELALRDHVASFAGLAESFQQFSGERVARRAWKLSAFGQEAAMRATCGRAAARVTCK